MDHASEWTAERLHREVEALADRIYKRHLPAYLHSPSRGGRGRYYEGYLRERLDMVIMSEVRDDRARLSALESMEPWVAVVFGIFGAAFRALDHVGMHLRAQTVGQYELLPQDASLLRDLCGRLAEGEHFETLACWGRTPDLDDASP